MQSTNDPRYVVGPGRKTNEMGNIIFNFLKFTDQILRIQRQMNYGNQYEAALKRR